MPLSPRHWRARHLLGAWILYWVALVGVTVGPGALALWRLRGQPKNTGSANFGFGDEGLRGSVISHGTTVWSLSASGWAVLLWLVVPPLLLWLAWLLLRPRAGQGVAPGGIGAATAARGGALPGAGIDDRLARDRQATPERR